MRIADDLALSSKWSITFHDPKSPELYASSLGAFSTISGFWHLYRAMLDKKILANLPVTVNVSVYRESAKQYTKPWHGEWNIDLHHDTNPMRIYERIILLAIGEQLTTQIRGLVLERRHDLVARAKTHFSLSIFTDVRDPELDIKNVLLSNNVISLDHCVSGKISFRPFQLLHIPTQGAGEEQKDEEVIDGLIPTVKYSMASLLKYKEAINNRSRGTTSTAASSTSSEHREREQSSPSSSASNRTADRPAAESRHRRHEILSDFEHRESVLRLFGAQCSSYSLSVVTADDVVADRLRRVLQSEGCIVCMATTLRSPYSDGDGDSAGGGRVDDEKTQSPHRRPAHDYGDSFLVAECLDLRCRHIAHCDCIVSAEQHISIRGGHCSQFFTTVELSSLSNPEIQKEIGYHINTESVTGKLYNFSFRINHLLSQNSKVSPQWPITVPSYFHEASPGASAQSEGECLQIFFENTELQIRRGTLQIAIAETKMEELAQHPFASDAASNALLHTVNFEIPAGDDSFAVGDAANIDTKIYQLRYVDPETQSVLVINVNLKLQPNHALQLLSLRYEFNHSATSHSPSDVAVASVSSEVVSAITTHHPVAAEPAYATLTSPMSIASIMTLMDSIPMMTSVPQPLGMPPAANPIALRSVPIAAAAAASGNDGVGGLQLAMSSLNLPPVLPAVAGVPGVASLGVHSVPPLSASLPLSMGVPPMVPPLGVLDPMAMGGHFHDDLTMEAALSPNIDDGGGGGGFPEAVDLNDPVALYYFVCTELGTNYVTEKVQNPLFFSLFFERLKNFFPLLMMHHLGHTVCRAIYSQSHCSMRHKLLFLQSLALSFTKIASNRQGSFSLICILSLMTTDSELQIVCAAFSRIVASSADGSNDEQFDEIILSQSGYHVIKKLVSFGHPHFDCILKGIATDFSKYATHHYGVPIIRSILDLIAADDAMVRRYEHSLHLFARHTPILVCDQYGNYVIQQLTDISPPAVTDTIKGAMRGQFSILAKHKFASNAVEKCLLHSLAALKMAAARTEQLSTFPTQCGRRRRAQRRHHRVSIVGVDCEEKDEEERLPIDWVTVMVRELLLSAQELINHKFGNYCLQTALTVAIDAEPFMADGSGQRLLQHFIMTVSPLLDCLRQNVRKKWHQLLISASNVPPNVLSQQQWTTARRAKRSARGKRAAANEQRRRRDGERRHFAAEERATFHHHY